MILGLLDSYFFVQKVLKNKEKKPTCSSYDGKGIIFQMKDPTYQGTPTFYSQTPECVNEYLETCQKVGRWRDLIPHLCFLQVTKHSELQHTRSVCIMGTFRKGKKFHY